MRLLIDADACPVRAEALKVAERHAIKTFMVSNGGIRPIRDTLVTNIIVAKDDSAADDWIADTVGERDIVVTADIPLASRTIEKGGTAIAPDGHQFTPENIGSALAGRTLNQHLRETGASRGFNKSFTQRDRSNFLQTLDRVIAQSAQTPLR